jgi:hypothetical protein
MKTLFKTGWLLLLLVLTLTQRATAQNLIVNAAPLEGLDITPDNMWGFQVQLLANEDVNCKVDGRIVFRNSSHSIKFNFYHRFKPGLNTFDPGMINPVWTYSSTALRELFVDYKVLPQGTYQYCIAVTPNVAKSEYLGGNTVEDCIYKQSKDLFSITLLEPGNNDTIYEYNPMLTWVATYPFLNELTYKLRVAEIKDGQNTENAIVRNNPIYAEKNIVPSSIVYPVYAKPLKAHQPYAWTVDAFYKGILLGGAQPWRFIISEDSLFKTLPKESSYIDVNIDEGVNMYYAVGTVKLKYEENDFLQNELNVKFMHNDKEIKVDGAVWTVSRGINYKIYDLVDVLRHNQEFDVIIEFKNKRSSKTKQEIKFKYVNPDFVK